MPDTGLIKTNSAIQGEKGCIANSLPGRAMRMCMENKGLLRTKGAMYAGTGNIRTITVAGMETDDGTQVTETYDIPETACIPTPPTDATGEKPYVLVYVGTGTTEPTGYIWVPFPHTV